MATKTVTHLTDDLDGSTEGVETIKFGLHGAEYELDLTKDNQDKLTAALEPFLDKARKAGGSAPRRSAGRAANTGSGVDAKAVRAWAASNNVEVPARGRIPNTIIEQYRAAGH